MTNEHTPTEPFQKKTERLDIRVSYDKKKAFAEACENQGDTPSNAVRRFIATYIRREQRDELASAIRFGPKKRYARYAVLAVLAAISGSFIWATVHHQKQDALANTLFATYDKNDNGLIDLGEISSNDHHLQRVLNIDGVDGITKSEFMLQGRMIWKFVNADTFQIIEDKTGKFKQSAVTRSSFFLDGKPANPDQKRFIHVDGEFVELTSDMTSEETLGLLMKATDFRHPEDAKHPSVEYSEEILAAMRKYTAKVVEFDLRNPDRVNITVLEEQVGGTQVKTLTGHQRSITWVEGRPTPELVMGEGYETAVLTAAR